jgi:hypothetical protein
MNKGSISGENRRFDGRAFAVEGAPIERNVNDIFAVQINCIGCDCVGESIERLLQRELEFSDDSDDLVKQPSCSPDHAACRRVDECLHEIRHREVEAVSLLVNVLLSQ